jgi:diamine N-acetyltransferase
MDCGLIEWLQYGMDSRQALSPWLKQAATMHHSLKRRCTIMSNNIESEMGPNRAVSLREITRETLGAILRLQVKDNQTEYVAPNAVSIAEAHFEPRAWFRAIYADEIPVGFAMLYIDHEKPLYYLWRYMVDGRYQGCGYGARAMNLLIDHVRTLPNAREIRLSYVPGKGSPLTFYRKQGFVDTGEIDHGELVMRKLL